MDIQPIERAITCPRCVISVMGDHAGEGTDAIFGRKIADIERAGQTFWLMKSPKARPAQVQQLCAAGPTFTIFVEPASKGGARPTIAEDTAREFSADGKTWQHLPDGLGPVTGNLGSRAAALVFDKMMTDVSGTLDLWSYAEFVDAQKPLKFILGCSTVCAIRKDMGSHPDKMKSRYRAIVAYARLAAPYCVWLK